MLSFSLYCHPSISFTLVEFSCYPMVQQLIIDFSKRLIVNRFSRSFF